MIDKVWVWSSGGWCWQEKKYTKKSLSHYNIVHLRLYTDWPWIKPGLLQLETGGWLSLPWYGVHMFNRRHHDTFMFQQFKFLIWAREISYENCLTLQRLLLIYCHDVNQFTIKFNLSLFMPWKHIEALETQRCDNNMVVSLNFYAGSVRHLPSHGNDLVLNPLDHMGTGIFMQLLKCLTVTVGTYYVINVV
jgi:hypothetical protein